MSSSFHGQSVGASFPLKWCSRSAIVLLAFVSLTAVAGHTAEFPERYVVGRVLVQPRAGLSNAALDTVVKQHGGRRIHEIKQIRVHVIELPPQANVHAVAEALRRNRQIKFAEPDSLLAPAFYPNDPKYPNAWHLPMIDAGSAWDSAQGNGVTIAILDSGVDTTHPDFQGRLVPGWNFYDNNDNVADVSGHGTAMAGIAAAASNNAIGVASVSFNARIMPLRVTDTAGNAYYSLIAAALVSAADNGARVANISFLGVSLSDTVDSAAQYMRSKGGVVVVSSGNTGELRSEPPRSSLTVVAGTDNLDLHMSISSWGDYVDVAAPGVSILTTLRGGSYGAVAGTSAASPIVAGVYALMMSARPGLAPDALDDVLYTTARDLGTAGYDPQFGNGRVSAGAAVARAMLTLTTDTQSPTVVITTPTGGAVSGFVPVDVDASDNTGVVKVDLYVNGMLTASDQIVPYELTFDSSTYPSGQLALQARAWDAAGNSAWSQKTTVNIGSDTQPPTVTISNPANGSQVNGTVNVSVVAADNYRVAKISLSIDGRQVAVSYGSSLSFNWTKERKGGAKTSTISARAEDAGGNAATAQVSVTTR